MTTLRDPECMTMHDRPVPRTPASAAKGTVLERRRLNGARAGASGHVGESARKPRCALTHHPIVAHGNDISLTAGR